MTFANLDLYFHMVNHYKKIRNAKAVVDSSSPKGYHSKNCDCRPVKLPTPTCTSIRSCTRSCSPDCRPSILCPAKIEQSRCYSAPATKRPEWKDWYACSKVVRDFCVDPNKIPSRILNKEMKRANDTPKSPPKTTRKTNKVAKSPEESKTSEPTSNKAEPTESTSTPKAPERKVLQASTPSENEDQKTANSSDAQEHEYLHFVLKITEDILRNNIYKDPDMEKLFESHIAANKGRLDEDRMRAQIENLKKELNLPLPKRSEKECACDAETLGATSADPADQLPPETLKKELNLPPPKRPETECACDDETLAATSADCQCCPAYQLPPGTSTSGTCACNNINCPGRHTETVPPLPRTFAKSKQPPIPSVTSEFVPLPKIVEQDAASVMSKVSAKSKQSVQISLVPEEAAEQETTTAEVENVLPRNEENTTSEPLPKPVSENLWGDGSDIAQEKGRETISMTPQFDEDELKASEAQLEQLEDKMGSVSDVFIVERSKQSSKDGNDSGQGQGQKISDESESHRQRKPEIPSPAHSKTTASLHSVVKIINRDDPDRPESQIVVYHTDESGEHCYCSLSLQKTALKIQVDSTDENVEYILIDGPVCIPKSMLETKTIPVLIENVPSMLLNESETTLLKTGESESKQNLFLSGVIDTSGEYDNIDSISAHINKMNRREKSDDYDLTPERETATDYTPTKELGPILKKTKDETGTSLQNSESDKKQNTKLNIMDKKALFGDSNQPKEGVQKISILSATSEDKSAEFACVPGICPWKVKRESNESSSTQQVPPAEGIDELAKETDKEMSTQRDAQVAKEPDIISVASQRSKRSSKGSTSVKPIGDSEIVRGEPDQFSAVLPTVDSTNKYHFLLMDVATSISHCDVHTGKPISISSPKGSLQPEYTLLVDSEYEHPKEANTILAEPSEWTAPRQVSLLAETPPSPVSQSSRRSLLPELPLPSEQKSDGSSDALDPKKVAPLELSSEYESASSAEQKDDRASDVRMFQFHNFPARSTIDSGKTTPNELTYIRKRRSDSITDQMSDLESLAKYPERERELSNIQPKDSVQGVPVSSQQPEVLTANSVPSSQKPHEGLKVRYSMTHDFFDQQTQDLIAKLDEIPTAPEQAVNEREENVAAINDKMKEFRKVDNEENTNRRFQISNPDNFEIRRVSTSDQPTEDVRTNQKAKRTCCGLGQPPKPKKRVTGSTISNTSR